MRTCPCRRCELILGLQSQGKALQSGLTPDGNEKVCGGKIHGSWHYEKLKLIYRVSTVPISPLFLPSFDFGRLFLCNSSYKVYTSFCISKYFLIVFQGRENVSVAYRESILGEGGCLWSRAEKILKKGEKACFAFDMPICLLNFWIKEKSSDPVNYPPRYITGKFNESNSLRLGSK